MRGLFLSVVAVALVGLPRAAPGCAFGEPEAVLLHALRPDAPFEPFAGGRLGVLQHSFATSYLVVAHLYLSGEVLSEEEQAAVRAVWYERMRAGLSGEARLHVPTPMERWWQARREVAGLEPPGERPWEYRHSGYEGYLNCMGDAFENALQTLEARRGSYGASSPELLSWVAAQDEVFANCSGGEARLPGPEPASADPLARADRAYQIASAHFYAGEFDVAEQAFRAIARDSSSPWHGLAPYLAARAIVRRASLSPDDSPERAALFERASHEVRTLLEDPGHADIHPACRRLLGYVEYRRDPEARLAVLSRQIGTRGSPTLKQDVWDYSLLLPELEAGPHRWSVDAEEQQARIEALSATDDRADWILTFRNGGVAHAIERWEATGSLAWLVAAMSWVDGAHPAARSLLRAASAVPSTSPATITLAYHRARLEREQGRFTEARALLDEAQVRDVASYSRSSYNLLEDQRALVAADLEDLLSHLGRYEAGLSDESMDLSADGAEATLRFGLQGLEILDRLPLSRLVEAAASPSLGQRLRRQVAMAAWVRAIVLSDDATSVAMAERLAELGSSFDLATFRAARDSESRRFAALMVLLDDPYWPVIVDGDGGSLGWVATAAPRNDGWWCPLDRHVTDSGVAAPAFLSATEKDVAREQWAAVSAAGSGPSFFLGRAIEFATRVPDDPRVPRALHRAVTSSRWACGYEDGLGDLSRRAFRILHARYPKSPWARRTRYWYDGGW